ncbi:MAG TPA: hypothetical protein VK348_04670 [Planctomycetota bacterium]|nr:hypothetical protein [Planctomycetota bacterium]
MTRSLLAVPYALFPFALRLVAGASLLMAVLPGQVLQFVTEQHPAGGCYSQAGTIMHLETLLEPGFSGGQQTITVFDTVPGERVALCYGDDHLFFGGAILPVFTHGPYLQGPEFFGPWCGWYTNHGVWRYGIANGNTTSFQVVLPVVPSVAFLGQCLWCQAMMSDPTPGWRQQFVTSRPIRLRVTS